MKHPLLFCVAAAAVAPSYAYAASTNDDPDTIVVYGNRLLLSQAQAGTAATVITREDLERQGAPFALDAITTAPGVTLNQTGGLGGATSIRIRGAASDQTLVLIDGVPVGDTSAPGGGFDFARLDTDQIERIEILRGPQSTLWGSEAIGGVVSITTRQPQAEDHRYAAFAEVGSFDSYRGGLRATFGDEKTNFSLGATASASDGFSKADEAAGNVEDDGYRSHSLNANLRTDLGPVLLDGGVYLQSAETEFDSFDFAAPGFVADGDERAESDELNAHLSLSTKSEGSISQRVLLGYSQIERSNFADEVPAFDAEGQRNIVRYELRGEDFSAPVSFLIGAERDGRETLDDDTSITSGFGLVAWTPVEALTVTSGTRIDDHEEFGSETTSRISASWEATPALTLRANWGQGFKAPSLFQQTFLCCGATEVPPDLQPERSEGFDVGALFYREGASFEVGYFELNTDDLIDFSFTLGGYENIARAETRGIEAAWAFSLPMNLNLRGSYTWLEAEDGAGNQLARLPEHSADGSLNYERENFSLGLMARHNGGEEDSAGTVDAWTRLDAVATWRVSDRVEAYARAENLTDTEYQQVIGYGTPGLSGTVGLRLRR